MNDAENKIVAIQEPKEVRRELYGKCSFCGKDKELENFGAYKICKDCLERLKKRLGKIKVKDRLDLRVCEPIDYDGRGARSYFKIETSCIMLAYKSDIRDIVLTISHESIHYVLDKTVGMVESYKFDGIAYKYSDMVDIAYGVIDIEV